MQLGEARIPEGLRVYAIGDIHGCDDLIARMHETIAVDHASRSAGTCRIVHLGDYVDRGPDTAAVIERLSRLAVSDENALFLRGNHESLLLDFLETADAQAEAAFLVNGGDATLASYGVAVGQWDSSRRQSDDLAARFRARLPDRHHVFFKSLRYSARIGDYFFCHAGVRPDIDLDRQDPYDLTWIREGFLYSEADFGAVVVHGHTPAQQPEIRPNRINVDTGAVLGGGLTCVVLEQNTYRFLEVQ
jgi:serine/threonine protein phosphatase 1